MNRPEIRINTTGDIGANSTVTQIFAPGQQGFEAERMVLSANLPIFSPEWFQFFQESVPLIGRETESSSLQEFMDAPTPFLWWGLYGPAGIGKSRLAHALVQQNTQWEGGFLAQDRCNAGAASTWQPGGHALWVVDYAGARSQDVSNLLVVLARRFSTSATKVRVLLLERSAGSEAGWWRSLIRQAGHQTAMLQMSLYGEPLELAPLGDATSHVLKAWLIAGGRTAEEAFGMANALEPSVLARATAEGRPLLLGLVAAALHRGTFDSAGRALPDDCIDDYLSRELRLMAEQNSKEDFEQACMLLFVSTLVGGQPEMIEMLNRTPEPPYVQQTISIQRMLKTLMSRGISERSQWALRPDALGERFIEIIAIRDPTVVQRYTVLPPYHAESLGQVVHIALHTGEAWGTLARMADKSVISLLALALQQGMTMRVLLIFLKQLARFRGAGLDDGYMSLLDQRLFGASYVPQIEEFMRAGLAYGSGDVPLETLQSTLNQADGADLVIWLVPIMVSITALDGCRLHRLCIWFADLYKNARITRVRELVLAANLLERMASGLIQTLESHDPVASLRKEWSGDDARVMHLLPQAIESIFTSIEHHGVPVLAAADTEDAMELSRSMSVAAIQLSYMLMGVGLQMAKHLDNLSWHSSARMIALRGMPWSQLAQEPSAYKLCVRNTLAANNVLKPLTNTHWDARWKKMQEYAAQDDIEQWVALAVDALKIASQAAQADPACCVVREALGCKDWLHEAIVPLINEGPCFALIVHQDVKAGRWDHAMRCARAFSDLLTPQVLEKCQFPEYFPEMMASLVISAKKSDSPMIVQAVELLEQMFDITAPNSPRSMLGLAAMGSIATNYLREGIQPPFKVLSFKVIHASAPDWTIGLTTLNTYLETGQATRLQVTSSQNAEYQCEFAIVQDN